MMEKIAAVPIHPWSRFRLFAPSTALLAHVPVMYARKRAHLISCPSVRHPAVSTPDFVMPDDEQRAYAGSG